MVWLNWLTLKCKNLKKKDEDILQKELLVKVNIWIITKNLVTEGIPSSYFQTKHLEFKYISDFPWH